MAATGAALALTAQTAALAQVAPTLPAPFVGAPTNDNPHAGQFSLTFDDSLRLFRVGRAVVGSNPSGYPEFDVTPRSVHPELNDAQSFPAKSVAGNESAGRTRIGEGALALSTKQ